MGVGQVEPKWKVDEVHETVIDPQRPIIDAHFHFVRSPEFTYEIEEYGRDTCSGHNIIKSIFVESCQDFDSEYPPQLKPVSETEYAAQLAMRAREQGVTVAGIVGRADLSLGDAGEEVLNAHLNAAGDLLKGIRQIAIRDPYPNAISVPEAYFAPGDLYEQPAFRRGLKRLGQLGFSFDAWHYHHQLPDFIGLARATPDTPLILDHFGTPLGVGPYRERRKEIFDRWRKDIAELAKCPNVVAKLGGLAMRDNGFGWDGAQNPPSSDIFVAAQAPYYHHTIECFGAERCMFESNFPVDKMSLPYHILFNGFKKMANRYSPDEQECLFYRTAVRTYRIFVDPTPDDITR